MEVEKTVLKVQWIKQSNQEKILMQNTKAEMILTSHQAGKGGEDNRIKIKKIKGI